MLAFLKVTDILQMADLGDTRWPRVVDAQTLNAQQVFAIGNASRKVERIAD